MNFVLGVADTLDTALAPAELERARSCGHVTVAPWNAIGGRSSPIGGTGATSAELRYFSRRRRETKDCKGVRRAVGHGSVGTYLKHVDQGFRKRIQCEFHLGKDYQ